jgi:U11/U12 small nuclear ribonucleoprotein SNRNP65
MAAPEQPLQIPRGCPSSTSLSPPRGDRTLLVRHLPAELTAEEKEDLLKYFGAQSVRVLSDKGRLVRARTSGVFLRGVGRRGLGVRVPVPVPVPVPVCPLRG